MSNLEKKSEKDAYIESEANNFINWVFPRRYFLQFDKGANGC